MDEQATSLLEWRVGTKPVYTVVVVVPLALSFAWAVWEDVSCWHVVGTHVTGDPDAFLLLPSFTAALLYPHWAVLCGWIWRHTFDNGHFFPGADLYMVISRRGSMLEMLQLRECKILGCWFIGCGDQCCDVLRERWSGKVKRYTFDDHLLKVSLAGLGECVP